MGLYDPPTQDSPQKVPRGLYEPSGDKLYDPGPKVTFKPEGATQYDPLIQKYAQEFGLDPNIFHKVIGTESSFNPRAVSKVGAQGLGQLMPETAKALGVTDPFDPNQNLRASARLLSENLRRHNGDWTKALAAYNGGEGANEYFTKHGTYEGYGGNETHNYIQSILGDFSPKALRKAANKAVAGLKEKIDYGRRHGSEVFFNGITTLARPSFAVEADLLNGKWSAKELTDDAVHAITHPKDYQKLLDGLETAIFHDAGLLTGNQRLAGLKGEDLHGVAKFLTDFGVSVVADATTYLPVADLFSWGTKGVKLLSQSTAAAAAIRTFAKAAGPIGDAPAFKALLGAVDKWHATAAEGVSKVNAGIKKMVERRPDLDNIAARPGKKGIAMTPTGKLARMGIENVGNHVATMIRKENARVLAAHASELKGMKYKDVLAGTAQLPLSVKRHSLMEVWKYGKDSDRVEAEAMLHALGVGPTEVERKAFPKAMGLFDYEGKIQENYVSKVVPKNKSNYSEEAQKTSGFFLKSYAKAAHTPFVKPFTQKVDPALEDFSVYDLMKNRWSLGAEAVRKKMIAHKTAELYQSHGKHLFENDDVIISAFDKDSQAAWFEKYVPDLPGSYSAGMFGKAARRLSDFWKIGIMGNFIPHGVINVGTVTMFRSNPWVAGRGFLYGITGAPKHLDELLEQTGGKTSYWREPDTMGFVRNVPGLGQWVNFNQGMLDKFENGYRASYLQFRQKMDGALEKADPLNRMARGAQMDLDIGGYSHPMRFISAMKALGGLYTTFRLDVVPRAALYAAIHHPGYLAMPGKFQDSYSNAFLQHNQEERMIGPYDDTVKMTTDPLGYLASPSTLGPGLGGLVQAYGNRNSGYVSNFDDDTRWVAGQIIPALSSVFKSLPGKEAPEWWKNSELPMNQDNMPQWVRFWNAVAGGYVMRRTSPKTDRRRHKVFNRAANR